MYKISLLFLILILIIPFAVSETELNLNLSSNQISENQQFDGTLEINLGDNMAIGTPIYFYINDELKYAATLKEAIKGLQNIKTIKESYKETGDSFQAVNYNFEKEGKLISSAIKFDAPANSIKYSNPISFNIQGMLISNSYPDSVYIDINNDGNIDYTYKGPLINKFEDLNKSNLAGKTQPENYASIKAQGASTYCVETTAKPSTNYKIFTITRKGKDWLETLPLKATISNNILKVPDCGLEENECCILSQPSQAGSEISCSLQKTIESERKVYICLFLTDGSSDQLPYDIGYFKDVSINKSFINGKQTDKNFFIYAQRQLFNTTLSSEVKVEKDASELKKIIGNTTSDLIPISIYSKSKGVVKISNLNFQYETDVPISMNTFNSLEYNSEMVSKEDKISIPLTQFADLTTEKISENNEIYVSFDDINSNKEIFDVIEGHFLLIQRTADTGYLGQIIEFLGKSSGNISTYLWDFGDNTNSTDKFVKHSYSKEGEYIVTLTTKDDKNIITKTSIKIKILSLKDSVNFLVQDTKTKLDKLSLDIESSSVETKEILSYLGITNQIQNLNTNLTLINNSLVLSLSSQNLSELDSKLVSIKEELDGIRSKLITDFTISTISFIPRAFDILQIPSQELLGFDGQNFQEKVLKYQETASVSGSIYLIDLDYLISSEKLTLVKKSASGDGTYYEVIPQGLAVKNIITQTYKAVSPNSLYQFSSPTFVYIFDGDVAETVLQQSATIIIPKDISSIKLESNKNIELKEICGDNICDIKSETSETCPEDCTKSKPWWVLILVILILAGGLFAIYYFKDKLFVVRSKPVALKLFNNEQDYQSIKKYIESSLRKGFTDMQIDLALKKQGWKENQIAYVLSEVKDRQRMFKK
jgi:PKD repeat protein